MMSNSTVVAPNMRRGVFDLFARYAAVLHAAWAARRELAGPARLAEEAAFLPAALSLQESPPHPAPRRAMWVIMALFVAALTWSIVGQVDVVAVASGRIVVSQRSKLIQPLDTSVVRAIHVKDGDRVREGQLLVELVMEDGDGLSLPHIPGFETGLPRGKELCEDKYQSADGRLSYTVEQVSPAQRKLRITIATIDDHIAIGNWQPGQLGVGLDGTLAPIVPAFVDVGGVAGDHLRAFHDPDGPGGPIDGAYIDAARLWGGLGEDTLLGHAGNDILEDGADAHVNLGEGGAYVGASVVAGNPDNDRICDDAEIDAALASAQGNAHTAIGANGDGLDGCTRDAVIDAGGPEHVSWNADLPQGLRVFDGLRQSADRSVSYALAAADATGVAHRIEQCGGPRFDMKERNGDPSEPLCARSVGSPVLSTSDREVDTCAH